VKIVFGKSLIGEKTYLIALAREYLIKFLISQRPVSIIDVFLPVRN